MGLGKRSQRKDIKKYSVLTTETSAHKGVEEGSGVLIWHGGGLYMLTAGHCFPSGDIGRLVVEYKDDDGRLFPLTIRRLIHHTCEDPKDHSKLDIGIVEVDSPEKWLPECTLVLGSLRDTEDDERFFAYGYPGWDRTGLECHFIPNCDDTWKLCYDSLGKEGEAVASMKGCSGAGIIDIYEDKCICVGVLRGFHDESNSYNKLVVTPSTIYESYLPDGKQPSSNDNPIEYQQPKDYFQRYCREFRKIAINHVLWGIDKNTDTLYDYLMGNVDKFTKRHILLAGAAQTGKSYEMQKLASDLYGNGYRVKLMALRTDVDIRKAVQDMGEEGYLLLDGLDEVKIKEMPSVAEKIKGVIRDYPAIRVVVSCRENFISYMEDDLFGAVILEDFDKDDVKVYLQRLGANVDRIYPQLVQNNLLGLCNTPFNLNTIVNIGGGGAEDGFTFPKSMVSVYEEYVGRLFKAEEEKPETLSESDRQECCRLLRKIAYRMVREEVYELSKEKILQIVGNEENINLILRNGVIKLRGNSYSFTSNTIREFLVAQLLTEYDINEVKDKVCEQPAERIRLKFRESVKWWLNHESSKRMLSDDVISWICSKDNDSKLLLECLPESVDEVKRLEIVKDILDKHKSRGSFYNIYYTGDFSNLFRFAYSPLLVEYITSELDSLNRSGLDPNSDPNTAAHLYNLLCLVSYLPWSELDDMKAKALKAILLTSLERFKDWTSGFSLLYWVIADKTLNHDSELVEKIEKIAGSCDNHEVLSAVCAIVYKGGMADKYVKFLIYAEEKIKDKEHLLVSRDTLYAAVGSLKEKDNVLMMLDRVRDGLFPERNVHGNAEYKGMVKNLLLTLFEFEEGEAEYKNVFNNFYPENYMYDHNKDELVAVFDEVRAEKKVTDEIVVNKLFKLMNPYYVSPEEQERRREIREKELRTLEDFGSFQLEVNKILTAYDKADDGIKQDVSVLAMIAGANDYAQQFAIWYSGWKNFDSEKLRMAISDRDKVELFQFDQFVRIYTNRITDLKLSATSIDFIKRKAKEILANYTTGGDGIDDNYLKGAMKLLVRGDISLEPEKLLKLLPYSFEEFEKENGEMRSILDMIISSVERVRLIDYFMKYLDAYRSVTTPNHKGILEYLMRKGGDDVKEVLYARMIENPESAESFFLLDEFLTRPLYRDRIKADYERFSEYDRMKISDAFGEEGMSLLENTWQSFTGLSRISALQKLLRGGSITALNYYVSHSDEFEDSIYLVMFNYNNPESLDSLFDLLKKVRGRSGEYLSTQRSLETSIGNIAGLSDNLLAVVVTRIKETFGDDEPYMLQFIDYCNTIRFQAKDNEELMSEQS